MSRITARPIVTVLEAGRSSARPTSIGALGEASNRQVVEALLVAMGQPADAYDLVSDRPGHDRRYAVDSTKLQTELGWEPRYSDFVAGLAATVEWYRDNEGWWRKQKADAEAKYAVLGR